MNTNVMFDNSLDTLVLVATATFGKDIFSRAVVLRDAIGHLTIVIGKNAPNDNERSSLDSELRRSLGAYARADQVLLYGDDPGAQTILEDQGALFLNVAGVDIRLIDRRIVGSGWLATPNEIGGPPPRVVFASLKGGVGRSTALAVTALDMASRGRNVLVVDLDLEAPGIGELMLEKNRVPTYGVVDYLVEDGIGGIPEKMLPLFVGTSHLTTSGSGRIDVLPALGLKSIEHPQNVLPKLARALIEDIDADNNLRSVGLQISSMINTIASRNFYDIVLIDSRAGLAELAAPAVIGLGANVLLFGTAQSQTIAGYRALFSALKLLAIRDLSEGKSADWRLLFKPVYAKASLNPEIAKKYAEDLYELFAENLYDRDEGNEESFSSLNYDADDADAPHAPLIIPFNQGFVDFDPMRNHEQLSAIFYEQTFRPFLDGLEDILQLERNRAEPGNA